MGVEPTNNWLWSFHAFLWKSTPTDYKQSVSANEKPGFWSEKSPNEKPKTVLFSWAIVVGIIPGCLLKKARESWLSLSKPTAFDKLRPRFPPHIEKILYDPTKKRGVFTAKTQRSQRFSLDFFCSWRSWRFLFSVNA